MCWKYKAGEWSLAVHQRALRYSEVDSSCSLGLIQMGFSNHKIRLFTITVWFPSCSSWEVSDSTQAMKRHKLVQDVCLLCRWYQNLLLLKISYSLACCTWVALFSKNSSRWDLISFSRYSCCLFLIKSCFSKYFLSWSLKIVSQAVSIPDTNLIQAVFLLYYVSVSFFLFKEQMSALYYSLSSL